MCGAPIRPVVFVHSPSKGERRVLEEQFEETNEAALRTPCQIIPLFNQRYPLPRIVFIMHTSDDTVRHVIARYEAMGLDELYDQPWLGRLPTVIAGWKRLLLKVIERDPRSLGVDCLAWTGPVLATYLAHTTQVRAGEARVRTLTREFG